MIGAILGDIIGSVYEFEPIKRIDFRLFSKNSSYTDDTIMTFAVMDWLLNKNDLTQTMQHYGEMYPDPMGGYGSNFSKWLRTDNPEPYNSWGNGSAMRVSAIGWAFQTLYETLEAARQTAIVSHNHPEGIKGAQATAASIFLARSGKSKEEIRHYIETTFGYNLHRSCDEIRPSYRFNESCQETVPEAIISFLDSIDFENAIRLAVSLGGDSDTLACITGGIAEAFYGVPKELQKKAKEILPEDFLDLLNRFHHEFEEYISDGKNSVLLTKLKIMKQDTLHAIMFSELKENGEPMYPKDLAEVIRKKGLYTQKDGNPLKDGQINARVGNYPDLFIMSNKKIAINDSVIPKTEKSQSSIRDKKALKANPTTVLKDGVQEVVEAKGCCETIENKQDDLKIAEKIIERAYELLIRKLGAGGLSVRNEMAFQIELGSILRVLGNMYEFSPEDKFSLDFESYINLKEKSKKSGSNRARVDILIKYKSIRAAIELKFFKKENHREPNNRYDVFNDLSNLEKYKKSDIDLCYFMLGTDHAHYVDPKKTYSQDTGDFDFRDGVKYEANTPLEYKTSNPYDSPICLNQSYSFNWNIINDLNFLKVKVL